MSKGCTARIKSVMSISARSSGVTSGIARVASCGQ